MKNNKAGNDPKVVKEKINCWKIQMQMIFSVGKGPKEPLLFLLPLT